MEKNEREKEAQHDVGEDLKDDEWKVGRKRKAGKEKVGGLGIKLRKVSSAEASDNGENKDKETRKFNGLAPSNDSDEKVPTSETKAPDSSATKVHAQGTGGILNDENLKDESICAGNLNDGVSKSNPPVKSGSGLVSYGSDDEDES